MNKVLGIVGSPRKNGNTYILVKELLKGAASKGALTELIFLNDYMIYDCINCQKCFKSEKCSQKDDMIEIYKKIINSNILIFGTPIYFYGPTAILKKLIDRLFYFWSDMNYSKIKGKKVIIVSPFGEKDHHEADLLIASFKKIFDYFKMPIINILLAPNLTNKGDASKNLYLKKVAYEIGIKITI